MKEQVILLKINIVLNTLLTMSTHELPGQKIIFHEVSAQLHFFSRQQSFCNNSFTDGLPINRWQEATFQVKKGSTSEKRHKKILKKGREKKEHG